LLLAPEVPLPSGDALSDPSKVIDNHCSVYAG